MHDKSDLTTAINNYEVQEKGLNSVLLELQQCYLVIKNSNTTRDHLLVLFLAGTFVCIRRNGTDLN